MSVVGEQAHHETEPSFPCPGCHLSLAPNARAFADFFEGEVSECPQCKTVLNLWTTILERITHWFVFGVPLSLAGARSTYFKFALAVNEVKTVDFTAHGVPLDAEILYLNFTPSDGAMPMLLHGNSPSLGPIPPKFLVVGRAMPDAVPGGMTSVSAVWHVADQNDTVIRHLVDAAHEYQNENFDAVVVPANIAAEAALTPVISLAFSRFSGRENIDDFLQNAATYAHQLNVLIPVVAYMAQASKMPDQMRGVLNKMRKLRNKVAHTGASLAQTRDDAAQQLTAAIFAARYAAYLRAAVSAKPFPMTRDTAKSNT